MTKNLIDDFCKSSEWWQNCDDLFRKKKDNKNMMSTSQKKKKMFNILLIIEGKNVFAKFCQNVSASVLFQWTVYYKTDDEQ